MELLMLHNKTNGEELDVMEYLAKCSGPSRVTGYKLFLLDPSPIIEYPCHSLTYKLTNTCLVDLIDVTLACEDPILKLVEVVTVANVDDEDRFGNSLLHTWELRLGNKAKLLFRL